MGYGPGGPPVLGVPQLLELLRHALRLKMASLTEVAALLAEETSGQGPEPVAGR